MKMRKQRLMGLAMLAITALILVMARDGKTPEDSDATAALLTGPLGLYMLLSKTYILYDGEEPEEATEASRSGEATPRAYINKHRKEGAYTWQGKEWSNLRGQDLGGRERRPPSDCRSAARRPGH